MNPYVYGADNLSDLKKVIRLSLSKDAKDDAEVERIFRESCDRWNSKKSRLGHRS